MGKVQILAVLTMDGCLSSELYDKAHQDLCLDRCGLDEIRKKALYHVTPDYSISMLHEWRKDGTNIFRSDGTCSAGRQQSFCPVCPAVCGRLLHAWGKLTHSAYFPFRYK